MKSLLWWTGSSDGCRFSLDMVESFHNSLDGVIGLYAIFYKSDINRIRYICIGHGHIRNRLKAHRLEPDIQNMASNHKLYYIWAEDSSSTQIREGMVQSLHNRLKPIYSKPTNVPPIWVNFPHILPKEVPYFPDRRLPEDEEF